MRAAEFIFESDIEHQAALEKTGFWGKQAAGCLFLAADTKRICIAHRSMRVEQPGTWETWGGAIDAGEDPALAVKREVKEEAGYDGPIKMIPLFVFSHPSGFKYYNFLAIVAHEFTPILDWETQGSGWFEFNNLPKPQHPGLSALLHDPKSVATIRKYVGNELNEMVNDKLFWTGYEKKKEILGGAYILIASAGYVGYGAKPDHKSTQFRIIVKTKKGTDVGWVNFEKHDDHLEALDLSVQPEHRRKGIATEMYRFARELGNDITPSKLQTTKGKQFWTKDHTKDVNEEIIDEMPLPADWDPAQYGPGTTYKKRLAYALERARKLGTGSSRVATIIEYQGRPTVLKIAKNQKGLAQNSVEAEILSDGYAKQMGILIPIIDYDTQNSEPTWVHTELAQKATEKQLCSIMKCKSLGQLINLANGILGTHKGVTYQGGVTLLRLEGRSDEDIETATEYADLLATLNNSFDVKLGDFGRKANWGLYQGKPVIIDVGFNSSVFQKHYSE